MTIEEIRDIPIAVFLARMGYEPARRRGDEYWYLAPYREERTASFQLNVRKDIWHDFGTGQGGDIFTLAGEFIGSGDFKAQARFITGIWGGLAPEHKTVSRSGENDREDSHRQESFTKVQSGPLHNSVLLRYLAERGISGDGQRFGYLQSLRGVYRLPLVDATRIGMWRRLSRTELGGIAGTLVPRS